ncbi:MAG TPA: T6SS effector amidase Tae4 family protein [Candidatus Angelobacter sp.]
MRITALSLLFATLSLHAAAQDLSGAFGRAEQIVRDFKPSSSERSERAREDRTERRTTESSQPVHPDWGAIRREQKREEKEQKRKAEEQERQRVQQNLAAIEANLVAAGSMPPLIPSYASGVDKSTATVEARRQWLTSLVRGPEVRPLKTYMPEERRRAIQNAKAVHDAMGRGEKPPFQPLWDYYEYNRSVAEGLVPDENRCAIVMSMTLGLAPRKGEPSVQDLADKKQKTILVGLISTKMLEEPVRIPAATQAEIGARYYLHARQLADRLRSEWGQPAEFDGLDAAKYLNGKHGIVFLDRAYLHFGKPELNAQGFRTGDHLDLWKGAMNATNSSMPFDKAQKVLFWELK